MKERPILFSGPMVRAILAGRKTQTRRVIDLKRAIGTPEVPDGCLLQLWYPGATLSNGCKPVAGDRCAWQVERKCGPGCKPSPEGVYPPTGHVDWEGPVDGWPGPYDGRHPVAWGPLPFWPGLRLWVKETFQSVRQDVVYRADGNGFDGVLAWRPSIFMPRKLSRITLEVTDVRVERLQDITEKDAKAEGVIDGTIAACGDHPALVGHVLGQDDGMHPTRRRAFEVGWDVINGDRVPWASNPWVWAVSFRRVQP